MRRVYICYYYLFHIDLYIRSLCSSFICWNQLLFNDLRYNGLLRPLTSDNISKSFSCIKWALHDSFFSFPLNWFYWFQLRRMSWLITQQVVTLPRTWVLISENIKLEVQHSSEKRNIYISQTCEWVHWSKQSCKRIVNDKIWSWMYINKILPSGLISSKISCNNQFRTIIAWGCWKWGIQSNQNNLMSTRTTSMTLIW